MVKLTAFLGSSGTAIAIGGALNYMPVRWLPWAIGLGFVLIVISVLLAYRDKVFVTIGHKQINFGLVLFSVAVCYGIGEASYFYFRPHVYPSFIGSYREWSNRLGYPLADAHSPGGAYFGKYDHATILWTISPPELYVLPDSETGWWSYKDTSVAPPRWSDKAFVQRILSAPTESAVPPSGLAQRWAADPPRFASIGWRQDDCLVNVKHLVVQRFEHGVIYGPYALAAYPGRHVFAIFDDGKWALNTVQEKGGECISGASP